jgi:sarcosine oxidase subunit gamma
MATAEALAEATPQRLARLALADLSCLARVGLKGPGAAAWLDAQGLAPPPQPNAWTEAAPGGRLLRLGMSEFLIEDDFTGGPCAALAQALDGSLPPGVLPVPRHDTALVLAGAAAAELLLETCNVDFASLDLAARPVLLTMMVGIAVTVLPGERDGAPLHRVWCDPTYGPYLWDTLAGIARELGGTPAGLGQLFPEMHSAA